MLSASRSVPVSQCHQCDQCQTALREALSGNRSCIARMALSFRCGNSSASAWWASASRSTSTGESAGAGAEVCAGAACRSGWPGCRSTTGTSNGNTLHPRACCDGCSVRPGRFTAVPVRVSSVVPGQAVMGWCRQDEKKPAQAGAGFLPSTGDRCSAAGRLRHGACGFSGGKLLCGRRRVPQADGRHHRNQGQREGGRIHFEVATAHKGLRVGGAVLGRFGHGLESLQRGLRCFNCNAGRVSRRRGRLDRACVTTGR